MSGVYQPDYIETGPPDLADVLGMVERLGSVRPMGRDGRRLAIALSAVDVEALYGLVIDGECYDMRWVKEFAVCLCGDGKHEFRRDAPQGRGHWHSTRRDVDSALKDANAAHANWYPNRPVPHMVTHLVATTGTEIVR